MMKWKQNWESVYSVLTLTKKFTSTSVDLHVLPCVLYVPVLQLLEHVLIVDNGIKDTIETV